MIYTLYEVTLDRLDMYTLYADMVGAQVQYNRGSMEMFIPDIGQIYHYPNGFMLMAVL